MKKLAILLVIAFVLMSANLFAEGTFRMISDANTQIRYTGSWRSATVVAPLTHWDWLSGSNPVPWAGIYTGEDEARWISWNNSGCVDENSPYFFRRFFTIDVPLTEEISRATIWVACDDTAYISVNGHLIGIQAGYYRTMGRFWIPTSVLNKTGTNTLSFTVINSYPSYMGLIYYLSIDYGPAIYLDYDLPHVGGMGHYISLPMKPKDPTLRYLFPEAFPVVFVESPEGNHHYSLDTPFDSPAGDTLLTYTFHIWHTDDYYASHLEGYPIYEHRYLNTRTTGWWYNSSCYCVIDVSDPDDIPDESVEQPQHWARGGGSFYNYAIVYPTGGFRAHFTHVPTNYTLRCFVDDMMVVQDDTSPDSSFVPDFDGDTLTAVPPIEEIPDVHWYEDPPPPVMTLEEAIEWVMRYGTDEMREDVREWLRRYGKKIAGNTSNLNAPEVIELLSPVPNPFNSSCNIRFVANQEKLNVKLSIFSVTGERIKLLFNGTANTGLNTVEWDGTDAKGSSVSSGIYLYRIESSGKDYVGRLFYLK